MIRVVLTGSESTGKTTLAERLARHYRRGARAGIRARLSPRRVAGMIEFSDHGPIARGQMALEDEHIARGGRLLIQDTDLLSTVVYCRHYFGACPPWIEQRRWSVGRTCISSASRTSRGSPTEFAIAGTCETRCTSCFAPR